MKKRGGKGKRTKQRYHRNTGKQSVGGNGGETYLNGINPHGEPKREGIRDERSRNVSSVKCEIFIADYSARTTHGVQGGERQEKEDERTSLMSQPCLAFRIIRTPRRVNVSNETEFTLFVT